MKKIILLLLFLLTVNNYAKNMDYYLNIAYKNNSHLNAIYKEYLRLKNQSKGASSLPDPQLKFGYAISPIETKNGSQSKSIGVSQVFPWFGTLSNMEKSKYKMAISVYYRWLNEKNAIKMQIKNSFVDLHKLKTTLKLKKELLKNIRHISELEKASIISGNKNSIFMLELSEKTKEVENDTIIIHNNMANVFDKIHYFLGDSLIGVSLDSNLYDSLNINVKQKIDLNKNPLAMSVQEAIDAAKIYKIVAKKKGYPSFLLGLNYLFIDDNSSSPNSGKDAVVASLGLKLPIYRAKYSSDIEQNNIKIDELDLKKRDVIEKLTKKYKISLNNIVKFSQNDLITKKQISIKEQQLKFIESSYSSSLTDMERLLNFIDMKIMYKIKEINYKSAYIKELNNIEYISYQINANKENKDEFNK